MKTRSSIPLVGMALVCVASVGHLSIAQEFVLNPVGCESLLPFDPWDPAQPPEQSVLCHPPGGGCPAPAPPTVLSVDSHEATLRAQVPADYAASGAWWRVLAADGSVRWIHASVQGRPPGGYSPGSVVTFGAPGLMPGEVHGFQVAFQDPAMTLCWSDLAQAETLPILSRGPAPPSGTLTAMEDQFDRPDTDGRCATPTGDGLGPQAVWLDFCEQIQGRGTPQIRSNMGYFPPSSNAEFAALTSAHQHTFADAMVRVDLTDPNASKYNFEIAARIVQPRSPTAFSGRNYMVKLILGPRKCVEPTLFAVWNSDDPYDPANEFVKASCVQESLTQSRPYNPTAGAECYHQGQTPPLDVLDPDQVNYPGMSKPVWLRIEVKDAPTGSEVKIRASAMWDCDAAGVCQHSCSFERIDSNQLAHQMYNQRGRWGLGFHEKRYYVDYFKAGSAPEGP